MQELAPQYDAQAEEEVRELFAGLLRQWREETQFLSSSTKIVLSFPYQRIIGLGRRALPLILEELQREPGHWFWALRAITGEDPVPPEDRGDLEMMRAAWLKWAEARNLLR